MDKRELTMLQALPLDIKIAKSKLRIEEFVRTLGGTDKVYISFSGGKDSPLPCLSEQTTVKTLKNLSKS